LNNEFCLFGKHSKQLENLPLSWSGEADKEKKPLRPGDTCTIAVYLHSLSFFGQGVFFIPGLDWAGGVNETGGHLF
jgi:hypothetical protein